MLQGLINIVLHLLAGFSGYFLLLKATTSHEQQMHKPKNQHFTTVGCGKLYNDG